MLWVKGSADVAELLGERADHDVADGRLGASIGELMLQQSVQVVRHADADVPDELGDWLVW